MLYPAGRDFDAKLSLPGTLRWHRFRIERTRMPNETDNFLSDPKAYMSRVAIESAFSEGSQIAKKDFEDSQAHDLCYMRLEPVDGGLFSATTRVRAKFSTAPKFGSTTIPCRYVPYFSEGACKGGTALPRVKLEPGGNPKFVFTGAMNGCSLVIATDAAGDTWGVHYPNTSGEKEGFPMLARDHMVLAKSMDYSSYGMPETAVKVAGKGTWCNTFAFFYFENEWKILAQCQYCAPEGMKFAARINYMLGDTVKGNNRSGVLTH